MQKHTWGCSSVGRAPALQAGGQEFDSPHLHHEQLQLTVDNLSQLSIINCQLKLDIENFTVDYISGQASKGIGWMPWHQEPKKDGASAETPRVAASRR